MNADNENPIIPVPPTEYDKDWISETWGWDDAEEFVRSGGLHIRPRVAMALEMAQLEKGMKILDVGCGRGEVVLHCARKGIASVGIDYSPDAIDLAQKAKDNIPPEARDISQFIHGDINDMRDSLGPFDRILLLDILEHLHDYELIPLLNKLKTLLSSEGSIVIHTLPNRWVYDITYTRIMRVFMPWLQKNPRSEKEQAIHINEMSIMHLDQLLRHCGLDCRVYLKEALTAQAAWHSRSMLKGSRRVLYRWFQNPITAALYRLAAWTPLRLLIVNDIFCIAQDRNSPGHLPRWKGFAERMTCFIGRKIRTWNFSQ